MLRSAHLFNYTMINGIDDQVKTNGSLEWISILREYETLICNNKDSERSKGWEKMAEPKQMLSIEDWKNVLEKSKERPILVFKHSITCPISATAYEQFLTHETDIDKYFLIVSEQRPVSNQMADDLDVTHQSPQIFLLEKEQALWHTSHWNINEKNIAKALKEHVES